MDQLQTDTCITVTNMLPELVTQLEIANKLKAIEVKWAAKASGHFTQIALNELDDELDEALKG